MYHPVPCCGISCASEFLLQPLLVFLYALSRFFCLTDLLSLCYQFSLSKTTIPFPWVLEPSDFWALPRTSHLRDHHLTEKTPETFMELHTPNGLTKNNVTLGVSLSVFIVDNCSLYFWNPCYLTVCELSGLPHKLPTRPASPLTWLDLDRDWSQQFV